MILLLDIGNTSIKIATYNVKTNKIRNYVSFFTSKKNVISKIIKYKNNKNIKYCFISSVVPSIFKMIKKNLSKKKIRVFEFKDIKIKKNILIKVNKKLQVGSDRIVNAIGALNYYKRNCIIIDFGTTTTFDVALSKNIKRFDGFVVLGCVVKGQTPHFDLICSSTFNAIINLSIKYKKPIGNGIITAFNLNQAKERSIKKNNKKPNKGIEAARAVIKILKNGPKKI